MRKKIIIKESQLKKLMENQVGELNLVDVAKKLKNTPCTGESIKTLVIRELEEMGYDQVIVNFIGYEDETNNLMYSIYTDGPMFVLKARSSGNEKPCLDVIYVQAYNKI